jgi:hypothetical protein
MRKARLHEQQILHASHGILFVQDSVALLWLFSQAAQPFLHDAPCSILRSHYLFRQLYDSFFNHFTGHLFYGPCPP